MKLLLGLSAAINELRETEEEIGIAATDIRFVPPENTIVSFSDQSLLSPSC